MEILAKEMLYSEIHRGPIICAVIVAAICVFLFVIRDDVDNTELINLFILPMLITVLIGMSLFSISEFNNRDSYTTYYVTIDDDYPLSEFYEKYEILDVNGKLYHIKERD